jgi:hypothetical protein
MLGGTTKVRYSMRQSVVQALPPVNDFVSAAAQDLLRSSPTNSTAEDEAAAEQKKKKAAQQTGDNAVIQGLPSTFNGAYSSLFSKSGNQF